MIEEHKLGRTDGAGRGGAILVKWSGKSSLIKTFKWRLQGEEEAMGRLEGESKCSGPKMGTN